MKIGPTNWLQNFLSKKHSQIAGTIGCASNRGTSKRAQTRVFLSLAALAAAVVPAHAGNLANVNYSSGGRNYLPLHRGSSGTHTAWICTTFAAGWCYYSYPTYLGGPCQCCGPYGCYPGTVTAYSSIEQRLRDSLARSK
jgi:hypothetical protein